MTQDILHDLGFFGHYLHIHAGGRGGKQFVLTTLNNHEGHLTQRELLEMSKISSASLSEVLSKLEAGGLIRRSACQKDRRQLDIELTSIGRAHAQQITIERQDFERNALSCLTADEQEELEGMLDRLVTHWKSFDKKEVVA